MIFVFGAVFQMLNSQVTTAQHMDREKAYDIVSECTLLVLLVRFV